MSVPSVAVAVADVALILGLCALLAGPFRRLRLPPVTAEITAGIALGPSVLGLLPGNLPDRLFPVSGRPLTSAIAEVGVLIFMFGVGWELDTRRGRSDAVAGISLASMAVPFAGGAALGLWLYPHHSVVAGHHVPQLAFVLFLGAAMAVTAFPVLARLIHEGGLQPTIVGTLALASAAVGDALAWIMLAVVSALAASSGPSSIERIAVLGAVYVLVLRFAVRPLVRWLIARFAARSSRTLLLVVAGIFLSGYAASLVGFDPIFGAFAFGLVMPRELAPELQTQLRAPLEHAGGLLMPVFFVTTGLAVNVGALGLTGFVALAAVLATACAGKFLGASGSARLVGMGWRDSWILGVLMNTRGLTELIILNVGVSLGVLDPPMFTIMVLTALITTAVAGPLLPRPEDIEPLAEPGEERAQAVAQAG